MLLTGMLPGLLHPSRFAQANHSLTTQKENAMEKINELKETKEYILLVYVPLEYDTEKAKEVREEWNQLLDEWKSHDIYVTSFVYPVKGYLISGPQKTTTEGSLTADERKLVSSIIINAAGYEDALSIAKSCPVLKQGATVEVREVQPRPVQAR